MVKPNSCSTNCVFLIQSVNLYDNINCYEMIMKYVGRVCFDSCASLYLLLKTEKNPDKNIQKQTQTEIIA